MDKAASLLYQLQQLQFALIEMQLYLDTHPFDQMAQRDLMQLSNQIEKIMPKVEKYYGPLTSHGYMKENPARWITEPWPWEHKY